MFYHIIWDYFLKLSRMEVFHPFVIMHSSSILIDDTL